MKGKIFAGMILGSVLMMAVFATPALANVPVNVTETDTGAAPETTEEEERNDASLTPDGNMTLVDDLVTDSGKQFITLTTRSGHYYYLIIDRTSEKEQNAYFLNQVDERDLLTAMSDEDQKDYEKELAEKAETAAAEEAERKAQEEAARKAAEAALSGENGAEETANVNNGSDKDSSVRGGLTLASVAALLGITALIGLAAFLAVFAIRKKKAAQASEPDPDAGYEDIYDNAYIVEDDDTEGGFYGDDEG